MLTLPRERERRRLIFRRHTHEHVLRVMPAFAYALLLFHACAYASAVLRNARVCCVIRCRAVRGGVRRAARRRAAFRVCFRERVARVVCQDVVALRMRHAHQGGEKMRTVRVALMAIPPLMPPAYRHVATRIADHMLFRLPLISRYAAAAATKMLLRADAVVLPCRC